MYKICTRCGETKSSSKFYKGRAACKPCVIELQSSRPQIVREAEYQRRKVKMPWNASMIGCTTRAKEKGIECTIDRDWARRTYTGKCAVSGLDLVPHDGRGHWPLSPSVDRLDQTKGYTPENCRWVCMGVNALRGSGDDKIMILIAKAIASRS